MNDCGCPNPFNCEHLFYRARSWSRPIIKHGQLVEPYGYRVWHPENLILGNNVDIGTMSVIHAHYGVEIQDNVMIGPHCTILSKSDIGEKFGKVTILKDSKIGAYSLIMPNSIVSGTVRAYSYVDGKNG